MKIVQINTFCGLGSTGRIAVDIYKAIKQSGNEGLIAYGRGNLPAGLDDINAYKIGNKLDNYYHALYTRITDRHRFASVHVTKKLIDMLEEYNPDIIHLHNIHGYYLNIEILFEYLKSANKPVVWTLHDCWAFTGHCAYFDYVQCDKWKNQCYKCPQKQIYPSSYFLDDSKRNYNRKKHLFNSVKDLTLVTPSNWLANTLKSSYLSNYNIQIIPNGINLNKFKPHDSNFKSKYNIHNKFIILGVANVWNERKGLNTFIQLDKIIDKDKYTIVLAGLNQQQIRSLPKSMLGLPKTNSVLQLAEIYTSADVFLNPTRDDNFPTTNIEALACGTPVITFNTGGSPESINHQCGVVLSDYNVNNIYEIIKTLQIDKNCCFEQAKKYRSWTAYKKYMQLYINLLK